jgi:hypothetical protein
MAKKKEWREGEMILTFGLTKIGFPDTTPLMEEWLDVREPNFDNRENANFEYLTQKINKVQTWSEDNLKMKFISPILELGSVMEESKFVSFFDKKLRAKVDGNNLSVMTDFVIGEGILNYMVRPYFHFQLYKPNKEPTANSMAQLLEAFLIGQANKNDGKPLYGCEVVGANWLFVIMENQSYCVSKNYVSTRKGDLLKIISILRKFREILETKLL